MRLRVFFGRKQLEWPLEVIRRISFNQRHLLVPIIFSGVFTPLVIVGFFKSYFHPVLALSFIIMGIVMFYIGWVGQMVLTIEIIDGHRDIPLRTITENVREFTAFFNNYITDESPLKRALFTFVGKEKDPERILNEINEEKEEKLFFSAEQLKEEFLKSHRDEEMILVLDPLQKGINVNYIKSEDGSLHPHVMSSDIKRESLIGVFQGSSLKELL